MDTENIKNNIKNTYEYLQTCDLYRKTPIINKSNEFSSIIGGNHEIYLKNETIQHSGSFKIRGLLNQARNLKQNSTNKNLKLITMSAGNYGRAFADYCEKHHIDAKVIMPDFSPMERTEYIENKGLRTLRVPTKDIIGELDKGMNEENRIYLHPYDDWNLIYGHASFGFEMLDIKDLDLVVVCCGGGGILAGTALAIKLFGGPHIQVYGVEPVNANTMERSLKEGHAVTKLDASSIASGLSPPNAGEITYSICQKFVDGVVSVTDEEIINAMSILHSWDILAEPSGSAATAAILFDKIEPIKLAKIAGNKLKIMIAVTGGNCSQQDFDMMKKIKKH